MTVLARFAVTGTLGILAGLESSLVSTLTVKVCLINVLSIYGWIAVSDY